MRITHFRKYFFFAVFFYIAFFVNAISYVSAQTYNPLSDICCRCTSSNKQSSDSICLYTAASTLKDPQNCESLPDDTLLDFIQCEPTPLSSEECAQVTSSVNEETGICTEGPMTPQGYIGQQNPSETVLPAAPKNTIPPIQFEPNVEIPGMSSVIVENEEANPLFAVYITAVYRYMLSITAVVATIMFIWGAFLYMVGSSMGNVSRGKSIMLDSIIGAFLVFGAVTILRVLNPDLTKVSTFDVTGIQTRLFYEDIPPTSIVTDYATGKQVPITGKSKGNSCYLNTFGSSDAEIKRRTKRVTFLGDSYAVHELAAADFQAALNDLERAPAGTAVGKWVEQLRRMPPYSANCGKKPGYPDAGSRTGGSYIQGLDALLKQAKQSGNEPCISCHLHEIALAIDFDSCHNPMCPKGKTCTLTDPKYNNIPPEVVEVFARHNIYWGGYGWKEEGKNWNAAISRRDAMHFEWHGACRNK